MRGFIWITNLLWGKVPKELLVEPDVFHVGQSLQNARMLQHCPSKQTLCRRGTVNLAGLAALAPTGAGE
jgi:hypothetical protein